MLEIPFAKLSDLALDRVIEEFVTREGTDYGEDVHSLEDKKAAVARMLEQAGGVARARKGLSQRG